MERVIELSLKDLKDLKEIKRIEVRYGEDPPFFKVYQKQQDQNWIVYYYSPFFTSYCEKCGEVYSDYTDRIWHEDCEFTIMDMEEVLEDIKKTMPKEILFKK